eukprot:TRINITY_DN12422_c0_g1_i1.p1 TRINITY_DN12422_c0_g1~~TRINITY_DN12422_c0_g1_i1.p1  ORF type:complete len:1100 (+),score=240.39 TRINITY_DN12422_c0_g1_i1:58-3357(+)
MFKQPKEKSPVVIPKERESLRVRLCEGRNLPAKLILFRFLVDDQFSNSKILKPRNRTGRWDEEFHFPIHPSTENITTFFYIYHTLRSKYCLGKISLPLEDLKNNRDPIWIQFPSKLGAELDPEKSPEISVSFEFLTSLAEDERRQALIAARRGQLLNTQIKTTPKDEASSESDWETRVGSIPLNQTAHLEDAFDSGIVVLKSDYNTDDLPHPSDYDMMPKPDYNTEDLLMPKPDYSTIELMQKPDYNTDDLNSKPDSDPFSDNNTQPIMEIPKSINDFLNLSTDNLPEEAVELDDWNKRFQIISRKIRRFTTKTQPHIIHRIYSDLLHLKQDFLYNVRVYGKIIISESLIPNEKKTIPSVPGVGGIAGGLKYLKCNIIFKFAVDSEELYDGEKGAGKVAGHDLKCLQCYSDCDIEGIHYPLMGIIDYRGFRLLAISMLPVEKEKTIVLNSRDGGKTVHDKSPELQAMMKKSAELLNLKEHNAGITKQITTYTAIDTEGHLGFDSLHYLLDFARVMPPEAPPLAILYYLFNNTVYDVGSVVQFDPNLAPIIRHNLKNFSIYQRLRPEFVKNYHKPLCSDAFSKFMLEAEQRAVNREIIEATLHLYKSTIPECAKVLPGLLSKCPRDRALDSCFRLTEIMHSRGVNVRHLGRVVYSLFSQLYGTPTPTPDTIIPPSLTPSNPSATPPPRSPSTDADHSFTVSFGKNMSLGGLLTFSGNKKSLNRSESGGTPSQEKKDSSAPRVLRDDKIAEVANRQQDCFRIILLEMFARVIKNHIRAHQRTLMSQIKQPLDEPFRRLVVEDLNLVFGCSSKSSSYWQDLLLKDVADHFHIQQSFLINVLKKMCKAGQEGGVPGNTKDVVLGFDHCFKTDLPARLLLLQRLQRSLGLRFSSVSPSSLFLSLPDPFDSLDLEEPGERIKHMHLVSDAEGYVMMMKALQVRATQANYATELLKLAVKKFEEALDSSATNKIAMRHCAMTLVYLHDQIAVTEGKPRSFTDPLAVQAAQYYQHILEGEPNDVPTLIEYAYFLDRYQKSEEAEEYYLRGLEQNPDYVEGLLRYGRSLDQRKGLENIGEQFLLRAIEVEKSLKNERKGLTFLRSSVP